MTVRKWQTPFTHGGEGVCLLLCSNQPLVAQVLNPAVQFILGLFTDGAGLKYLQWSVDFCVERMLRQSASWDVIQGLPSVAFISVKIPGGVLWAQVWLICNHHEKKLHARGCMLITLCSKCSGFLHLSFTLLSFNMHIFNMSHLAVLLIGSTVTVTHAGQILDAFNPLF